MSLSFYVLKNSGNLLYSQQVIFPDFPMNNSSPLLLAGFFSAIENFAREIINENLNIMEMGNYKLRFAFQNNSDCIFCLIYYKNQEDQKFKFLLNTLKTIFFHIFKKEITKEFSDLTLYKSFDPILKIILEAFEIKNEVVKIEHFLCGFLSEIRDFQSETGLLCPNCKKSLSHENVDYRIKTLDK